MYGQHNQIPGGDESIGKYDMTHNPATYLVLIWSRDKDAL